MNDTTDTLAKTAQTPQTPDYYSFEDIADNIFIHGASETSVLINLAILASIAAAGYILAWFITRVLLKRTISQESGFLACAFFNPRVLRNLSAIVPSLILQIGIPLIPDLDDSLKTILRNFCAALTIFSSVRAVSAFLDTVIAYQEKHSNPRLRSYKGLVQLTKMGLYILGAILIAAILIDRSPTILISSLGAMSAITMLIFKDTIVSFVAGAQIASNDMLRVGDWIEMPQVDADGTVIDIALHTVKVQNSDKSIITIPTWRLISESYKNWRGMYDVKGRRIKRSINIDVNSVKFMTSENLEHLSHVNVLRGYLKDKLVEIEKHNTHINQNAEMNLNRRRLTNIGTFRAYALSYLRAHPKIRKDLSLMVRQLQPTTEGIPLEIYCFTDTTASAEYENIQSDIFDHLYATMPEFDLAPFQQVSGRDLMYSLSPDNTHITQLTTKAEKALSSEAPPSNP